MANARESSRHAAWRETLRVVIFEAETPPGKAFDVALLIAIVVSVVAVMLESVVSVRSEHGKALRAAEWIFTLLFTVEYALRLASVPRAWQYARSFFGVVDLLAIAPTYVSVLLPGAQSLL
jgi:voltage-gated potassium channel